MVVCRSLLYGFRIIFAWKMPHFPIQYNYPSHYTAIFPHIPTFPLPHCPQINYIDILSLLNLNKGMQRDQNLEQKLRKSQSLGEEDIYKDFMQYAKQVQDEMDIYLYMQQNQIGLGEAKYWLARLEVLRKQCKLKKLVKEMRRIKKLDLNESWEITRFQRNLQAYMKNVFSMQFKGKRKAADFNISLHNIHPEKRKIGNIQVYVDEKYRHNYELEDLAAYIEDKMMDHCEIEKQCYAREQGRKPPSFIAKREMHLLELAQQVIQKANRKSQQERKSMGPPRVSVKVNQGSVKIDNESFNTPRNHENVGGQFTERVLEAKEKRLKDSSRDSIEILKSMRKEKKEETEYKSPKFIETSHIISAQDQDFLPIQRCRFANNTDNDQFLSFSFGKSKKSPQQCKRILDQRELQNKDNAFMFHSFSQDSRFLEKQNLNFVKKQDFQLELIIKQIQRETYQKMDSKTFSEIDSNQENQYGNQNITFFQPNKRERKPFEILLQAEGKLYDPKKSNMKLQELMDYDDETQNKNPEDRHFLSQQLIQSGSKRPSIGGEYHSQSKRPLSNISQQNSCFYSQSKNKHRISK